MWSGSQPPGSLALFRGGQARSTGRDYVLPMTLHIAVPVLGHRLILKPESHGGKAPEHVVRGCCRLHQSSSRDLVRKLAVCVSSPYPQNCINSLTAGSTIARLGRVSPNRIPPPRSSTAAAPAPVIRGERVEGLLLASVFRCEQLFFPQS